MNFLVINLRKYFFTILFFLFLVSLLVFSNTNFIAAQNGLVIWATKVLPSLFPFFVGAELLCSTNFTYILGKALKKIIKPIFNVPSESIIAIILGIISGYPVGAKVVCNLKKQKIISKIEAERLIAFTNNSSPLFILGTVGIALFGNQKIGLILLFSHIISSILVGYFFRFWKSDKIEVNFIENKFNSQNTPIKVADLGEILGNSIKKSITITGIIELTNGVTLVSNLYSINPLVSILIVSFLLGFGGFSVLLQVYSIIAKENISIKPYFYGKLLHGLFSVTITYILFIVY